MLTITTTVVCAPQYHAHSDIQKTVTGFVEDNLQRNQGIEIETKISKLDSRLRLTQCEIPLSAFTTAAINQTSKFSVGVKCNGKKPWSLYVSIKVIKTAQLYVASAPLSRGEVINEDKIIKVKRDISKLRRGFYKNKHHLVGMIAKRSIRAGTIFSEKHLTPPLIIKKGDSVNIIAKTSALTIRMQGKAMSDGAKGQRIKVKNNSSRRVIEAIAITPGIVKVRL